jgi:mRNA interferase YafQ
VYKKLERSKAYLKDIRKINFSNDTTQDMLYIWINFYLTKPLPPEALDHPLKSNYQGFREFHISGDMLVIYKIVEDTLYLARIGTHA